MGIPSTCGVSCSGGFVSSPSGGDYDPQDFLNYNSNAIVGAQSSVPATMVDWIGRMIQDGAFAENTQVQTAVFANVDGGIGAGAFRDCPNLQCVSFPKKQTIDANNELRGAFAGCDNLRVVEFTGVSKSVVEESLALNDNWGIASDHVCVVACVDGKCVIPPVATAQASQ